MNPDQTPTLGLRISERWAAAVIQRRWWVIGITLLLVALAPLSFKNLYHDNSIESYFLENDPHLESFNHLVEHFGDPEYLSLGIEARPLDRDLFNAETIGVIAQLTEFLENHRHITQVRSLSKYQYTHNDGGLLATDDLFDDLDSLAQGAGQLQRARETMAGERLALGTLISEDFKHTRIVARTTYKPGENKHNVELVQELRAFIDAQGFARSGFNIHMSGVPVIGERFETLTQSDMAWINPTMGVIMIVILLLVFRSLFATLVPMVVIITTIFLVTSLQGFLHWPLTAVNSALIPTTIILAIGASIHVLVEFFHFRRKGLAPPQAASEAARDLLFPVLFTCLTTSVGFATLAVTELRPVREFALLAAVMPMVIFVLATTTLVAVLSFVHWMPRNAKTQAQMDANASPVSWALRHLPHFTFANRRVIGIVGLVIVAFSGYGVSKITVDANVVNYFKHNSWVNRDLLYFNEQFKGISNLEVIVDTGVDGGVKDPQLLQRADALQAWLESFDETGKATSLLKFYKQINQALNEDRREYYTLPTSVEMAAQFLLLYENTGPEEDLSDLKDFDERYLRIQVPVINMDETATTRLLAQLSRGIDENFADLNLDLTGSLVMNNVQNRYTNNGMFRSFTIAIVMIGLCFVVLFRSLKYGAIALVPSIIPVLLTGGVIALLGISLDLGTMIVGAMTIGIAVDDAIHLMSRYLLLRGRGRNVAEAIEFALASSGRAVVLTSVILVTGFSVMLLGSFISYIYVGLFSAMIMLLALLGDLIFMPAILFLVDGRGEKNSQKTIDEVAHVELT